MEINCYKKMALHQTQKIVDILISKGGILISKLSIDMAN